MFAREILAAAQAHGRAEYPREAVGLVIGGAYRPLVNIAADPENEFVVADDLTAVQAEAVMHSHPEGWPVPSARDMRQQQAMDIAWGVYSIEMPKDEAGRPRKGLKAPDDLAISPVVWFGRQAPKGPLIGRGFIHGHQDCVSLILDWHAYQGISMPEPPRDWEWWLNGGDLYRDNFRAYGFDVCEPMLPGSVFMVALGEDKDRKPVAVPNHAGVYLGNNLCLHHLTARKAIDMTRLSARQPFGRWGNYFNAPPIWVRHKDLPLHGLKPI